MQTTIMLLFYGFLAGILVMCAGFSTRKRASRRVAETISANILLFKIGRTLTNINFIKRLKMEILASFSHQ